jgi:predicted permease
MWQHLRFGLRVLRRYPTFACGAIAVMALGVGATTAVYSVLRGVLLTPLPYRDPGQLVVFRADSPGVPASPTLTSLEFAALREQTELFESVAAAVRAEGNLTAADVVIPLNAAAVSENFLETLGVAPVLGRAVGRADPDARRPIDISHEVWQRYLHGDPAVLDAMIEVNGSPASVAGVLPPVFRLYVGADALLPSQIDLLYFRGSGYDDDPFRGNVVIARLRHGVTIGAAQAAADTIAKRLVAEHPDRYRTGPVRLSVASVDAEVVGKVKPALVTAAGAVLFVWLAACANQTNLLLVRASARTREIAVRISVGARRRDIVQQMLAEGLVIGAMGAAAGWLVARWGVDVLLALAPAALPRREAIALDGDAAFFAMAMALLCAVVVSLLPAWQSSSGAARAGNQRATSAGEAARGLMVAAQLAFSVVLLVGTGLTARAFVNLTSVPLGFDPSDRASMYISLGGQQWNDGTLEDARARRRAFFERLTDEVHDLAGVQRAGVGFPVPLAGISMSQRVSLGPGATELETDGFIAFAGYLEALGVPLVAGRYLTRADHGLPVALVDERLAQRLWPGESAVGRRLLIVKSVEPPQWVEVVGVVAHVQTRSPRASGPPQVWMTYAVRAYAQMNLVVQAADPIGAATQTAVAVRRLGAARPVRDIRALQDQVTYASADIRFALFVLGVLAAVAVTLAAVGVHGVVSYTMRRRTREIAVRLALGASPRRLVAPVLFSGSKWTFLGLGCGLAGAGMLARTLDSLLFRVERHDALTFAAVAVFLATVALAASVVPALRAAHVDPMLALRGE